MHTDAAQAIGKIPVDVQTLRVDMLSIAGHKLYAPKGVGALFVRDGIVLENVLHGADHEHGMRPGTENVLLAVGLGQACEASQRDLAQNMAHTIELRKRLEEGLLARISEDRMRINARNVERLPNTTSVSFLGIDAAVILAEISQRIAASAGAACHADMVDMSPVLMAIGLPEEWAMGTIRLSAGRETTAEEIDEAVQVIADTVERLQPGFQVRLPESGAEEAVNLTRFTKGMGCACKIRPQLLEDILRTLPRPDDARVLVDMSASDDAAVFQISEDTALVQTVDFLTPIVDDPHQFGLIAAANSLSDVYAMGATPVFALNLVAFPSTRLPPSVLHDILKGAAEKCAEAGVSVLGGHSIDDPEPKFGMVVSGIAQMADIWTNAAAKPGDVLILTKPVGTGLIATGLKLGVVSTSDARVASDSMATLNAAAMLSFRGLNVSACTDVTGFGLLGHTCEMLVASGVDAEITASAVPVLPGALTLANGEIVPGGTRANLEFVAKRVRFNAGVGSGQRVTLADAQTSGGLLLAIAEERAEIALERLHAAGVRHAQIIGRITQPGLGFLTVGP